MEATGVLGVLGFLEESVEVVDLQLLLSLLGLTSQFGDGLEGGVQVAGAQQVADVEAIDLAVTLEVVDLEGELDPWLNRKHFCLGLVLNNDNVDILKS